MAPDLGSTIRKDWPRPPPPRSDCTCACGCGETPDLTPPTTWGVRSGLSAVVTICVFGEGAAGASEVEEFQESNGDKSKQELDVRE